MDMLGTKIPPRKVEQNSLKSNTADMDEYRLIWPSRYVLILTNLCT